MSPSSRELHKEEKTKQATKSCTLRSVRRGASLRERWGGWVSQVERKGHREGENSGAYAEERPQRGADTDINEGGGDRRRLCALGSNVRRSRARGQVTALVGARGERDNRMLCHTFGQPPRCPALPAKFCPWPKL